LNLRRTRIRALVATGLLVASDTSLSAAELKAETIRAWNAHIEATEARIAAELETGNPFFVHGALAPLEATEALRDGEVFVGRMETLSVEGKRLLVPKGRIHHWVGSVLIRNVSLSDVLSWLRDCHNFELHFEEVERARTLTTKEGVVQCFLRMRGKKVRTVHYNTEQTIRYRRLGERRATSRTEATRIAQIRDPGSPNESEMPVGNDSGYLWRWNSYWRFQAAGDDVIVECETISLSRSVPPVLWWFVKPFLASVPRDYLESTLTSLRDAIETTGTSEAH